MNDSLFSQASTALPVGLPDGGELGAMTLEVSINDASFNLIYRALDEVFDYTGRQLARGLIGFAQQHDCGYALLVGSSCWIAASPGLSIAAQVENNAALKNHDLIVLPLDDMVYLAAMDQGLLHQEKVYPVNKALELLLSCEDNQQVAILAGGKASRQLQQAGLDVNCPETLFTQGREARPYTYQPLNQLLLQHRLYHPRLLVPTGAVVSVVLILGLLFYYYSLDEVKVIAEQKVQQVVVAPPPPPPPTPTPPNYLNNHAGQVLMQLRPWLQAPWLDFLTTCRLTDLTLNSTELAYQGQWMDDLEQDQQGCGNTRLQQVVQDKQLQLDKQNNGWRIHGIQLPVAGADRPRANTRQTLHQLQQLARYLGWRLTIKSTKRHDDDRDIQLTLAGNLLDQAMLAMLIEQLLTLPARMEQTRLTFNPDSLHMEKAEFDLTVFTTGEQGP